MRYLILKALAVAAGAFSVACVVVPDAQLVRFLAYWSLAMAAMMLWIVAPLARKSLVGERQNAFDSFVVGLFIMNLSLVLQRALGIAVRDFGQAWLIASDFASLTIGLALLGQSFKMAGVEAVKGEAVSITQIVRLATISAALGGALAAGMSALADWIR